MSSLEDIPQTLYPITSNCILHCLWHDGMYRVYDYVIVACICVTVWNVWICYSLCYYLFVIVYVSERERDYLCLCMWLCVYLYVFVLMWLYVNIYGHMAKLSHPDRDWEGVSRTNLYVLSIDVLFLSLRVSTSFVLRLLPKSQGSVLQRTVFYHV